MVDRSYHVVVVGGGPAGSSTALRLAELGRSVLLVERTKYERFRIGETLPPGARPLLEQLGLWASFASQSHRPSYAIHSWWAGSSQALETNFIFSPYGCGWHLDRNKFDSDLAAAAERGGVKVLLESRVEEIFRKGQGWELVVHNEEGRHRIHTTYLVDAAGRSGRMLQAEGRRICCDRMIGIAGTLQPWPEKPSADPVLLLEAVEDGWWYSVPLPSGCLLATFLTDADYVAESRQSHQMFWSRLLQHTVHTKLRAQNFDFPKDVHIYAASTTYRSRSVGANWAAVGDSASTFDPLSAAGICKAIQSGLILAEGIHHQLNGTSDSLHDYERMVLKEFRGYMKQRLYYYGLERRWPKSRFWSRRQAQETGQSFDRELSLGRDE